MSFQKIDVSERSITEIFTRHCNSPTEKDVIAEKQQVVDERVYPKQHLLAGCFFGLHMIEYYFLPNLRPVDFMDQTLLEISFLVEVSKLIICHNWDNPFGDFTSS